MKNNARILLVIGFIAFCLTASLTTTAQQLQNGRNLDASKTRSSLRLTSKTIAFDETLCDSFPKENVFTSFKKALQTPRKVRCLNASLEEDNPNMKRLPSGLGTLVNLEVLSFACLEQLQTLPEEIGNLTKLRELIIDNGNGCAMNISLPRSIGKLQSLKVLTLYGAMDSNGRRNAGKIPDTIGNLRQLEVLDLGRNGLNVLPPQIANLSNLKTLRFDYNSLRVVPIFVGNLKNLKELSFNANENISTLPASFSKFRGLTVALGNNSLKLKDQRALQKRFPKITFSFENEHDDERANQER